MTLKDMRFTHLPKPSRRGRPKMTLPPHGENSSNEEGSCSALNFVEDTSTQSHALTIAGAWTIKAGGSREVLEPSGEKMAAQHHATNPWTAPPHTVLQCSRLFKYSADAFIQRNVQLRKQRRSRNQLSLRLQQLNRILTNNLLF